MGCDIHTYPEFARGDSEHWSPVGGRFNPGRDYDLFGKIAGVRTGEAPMFPVRGLPEALGYEASSDSQLFITDSEGDGFTTPATAARWVAEGSSRYTDDTQRFVTRPDWHSHTWLTPSELRQTLEAPARWEHDPRYWALLAMLEELERRGGRARLVIWFDN